MAGIIWLASYPKSGNTWLRAFLTSFLSGGQPVDINDLKGGPIASARATFDDAVGVEASELTQGEIDRYRPEVYKQIAEESDETLFLKIHDAYTYTSTGEPLVPAEVTLGAIYVIRNPLDVAVSLANHSGICIDKAVERIGDKSHSFSANVRRLSNQLRQKLLNWSDHVLSWVDASDIRVHVVRYEDMKHKPLETFTSAVRFAGLCDDPKQVRRAIELSSFQRLQHQEQEHGFKEKSPRTEAFFHKGETGSWREVLNEEQVNRIIEANGAVMRRFGYLNGSGDSTYYGDTYRSHSV